MKFKQPLLLLLSAAWFLQGCGAVLVGGAATGAGIVHDRRSAGTVVDDKTLQINLASQIESVPALANNSHVNVTVYAGQVLLTGEAANPQVRQQIEALVSRQAGVQKVANHIIIGPRSSLSNRFYDSQLTAKLKAVLLDVNVPGFDLTRVKVVTEHGVGYLMGILTPQEAQAVTNVTRRVSGVRQIVTLFDIDNQLYQKAPNAM